MQVIIHTGAHCTDNDRLLKGLLHNADDLHKDGISVPGPRKYRKVLGETINHYVNSIPPADAREVLLDEILGPNHDPVQRLFLSNEHFFSVPKLMFSDGRVYRKAEMRLNTLCQIFATDDVQLCMGLRDPATFLPAALAITPHTDLLDFLCGVDPEQFYWSDLIRRIHGDLPDLPITLWCNEETPFLWGDIIRSVAGIAVDRQVKGAFDLFSTIISKEGMERFEQFRKENPALNPEQTRRVMMAFLDKFALEDEVEEVLDLPGWNEDLIERLTANYERDLDVIAAMPGVTLLTP